MNNAQTLRSTLRSVVPFAAWQTAGFLRRIPSYWRLDRSEALRIRHRVAGLPLYISGDLHVFPPESVTAYLNWRHHGVEVNESSAEAMEFLELSKGCAALVDIGAQTGFLSALFARSRPGLCRILSVEPDPLVLPLLERAVALNRAPDTDWAIAATAISDRAGRMAMPVSNRLHERAREAPRPAEVDVNVTTLAGLLAGLSWRPDIIKIDVESFEHEILCSSLDVIEKLKPALQLEVHWRMLADRGRSAADFLGPLASLGYRGIKGRYRNLDGWLRAGRSEIVSRLALSV
jgi:FkbM family methyltransferase